MSDGRLSLLARHLIVPKGIRSSEFPAVEQIAARCGVQFDQWQRGLGTLVLAKRADGQFAAGSGGVVMSIPRQIGKTFTTAWDVIGESILHPRTVSLWTAHVTRTSDETFRFMEGLANGILKPWVKTVRAANGQQEIDFSNNSRILFGARERGFGRGFSGIDIEVFDEAQILGERALDDMVPAMNASRNPLMFLIGTPPKPSDDSEVFTMKRRDALEHAPHDMLYVEFSADEDADVNDRSEWRKANPSYPARTSEASMLRMKNMLGVASFRREGLGIWDRDTVKAAIKPSDWTAGTVDREPDGHALEAFGLDMSPDRSMLTIVGVKRFDDDRIYAEIVDRRNTAAAGTQWAVDWIASHWDDAAAVAVDQYSGASTLIDPLKDAGVNVTVTKTRDLAQGCGMVMDAIRAHRLFHPKRDIQTALWRAVDVATLRNMGKQGLFAFNRPDADSDISPLMALVVALWAVNTTKRDPDRVQEIMV